MQHPLREFRRQKAEPDFTWRGWVQGKLYRVTMRLAHRLGYCHPVPTLVDPAVVWCHWCGMRGQRTIIDRDRVEAAMTEKGSGSHA